MKKTQKIHVFASKDGIFDGAMNDYIGTFPPEIALKKINDYKCGIVEFVKEIDGRLYCVAGWGYESDKMEVFHDEGESLKQLLQKMIRENKF